MTAFVSLAISLVLIVLAWLMPALARPTLQFGVRVPADHADEPVIGVARTEYRRWIVMAGGAAEVVAVGLAIAFGSSFWTAVVAVGSFCAVFGVFTVGYVRARHRILVAKQLGGWYVGRRQGVAVDTSLRTEPEPVPWAWLLPALLVVVGTAVVGIVRYPAVPAMLAMHHRLGGTPDHLVAKSVGSAFATVFVQAGVTLLIVALTLVSLRSKPDIDAAAPVTTARQHRVFLARMARSMFVLAACIDLSMAVIAWFVWAGDTSGLVGLALVPIVVGVGIVIGVAVRTGQEGGRVPVPAADEPASPVLQRDDDSLWRGGLVYVNADDPALFVPKRFGIGWAVNLGNRLAWVLLVAIAGFIVAAITLFT
jgi:uncharacterized membrane protein